MKVSKGSMIVIKGIKKSGLYHLVGETVVGNAATASVSEDNNTMLWHMRLGLISERGLQILNEQKLFRKDKISKIDFCEHCILGKHHRLKFKVGTHESKSPLEYVHSDL